jgi:hypothetical protein
MKNILFINHKIKNCGVYQYGYRSGLILKNSIQYNFIYVEISSLEEYITYIKLYDPLVVIYNNHGPVMPWLTQETLKLYPNKIHIGIVHEGPAFYSYGYHYGITQNPIVEDTDRIFSVPRPLLQYHDIKSITPQVVTINSFGFSFNDKGYDTVVKYVCENFNEAIINLHTTTAFFDRPKEQTQEMIQSCISSKINSNIQLNITTDFISDENLLKFLASSTINFFPYVEAKGRGISSVIDYALSVDKPIGITKSDMFNHIKNTTPSICIEDRSLKDIIDSGVAPLYQYKEKWSNANFITKYNYIIDKVIKENFYV